MRTAVRMMLCSSLILLSTSSSGCLHARPPASPEAVCKQLTTEEWAGYNVLVQVARVEKAMGDPVHVAATVSAWGAQLKRCWPEKFEE